MQQLELLRFERNRIHADAGRIPAGAVEALGDARSHRIDAGLENDRDCPRGGDGSHERVLRDGHEHGHKRANQIGCERRQPVVMALRPTKFDGDILAVDIAVFAQAPAKVGHDRARAADRANRG